ncbi:MAG TPA: malate synthase A [Polyangiaceae bacterium]|nr:malate synthase A [Polyangiaceae bacterium]
MTTSIRIGAEPPARLSVSTRPANADRVLTDEALDFVATLSAAFSSRIDEVLAARHVKRARLARGGHLRFLPETRAIRESDWKVAPTPRDLVDRRVEITGPVDRKMIINAMNSGANVFMADFEDSTSPTFSNVVDGQQNLIDAVRRAIRWSAPDTGKVYALDERTATLFVRPRGLHLLEKHVTSQGQPIRASLFDFGLYFFHNARALCERGTAPYFYLPKLESHLEARVWHDVFVKAEETLHMPLGTIRATVLIETLPAAFEMDEILYELRDYSAGLNCGRWDYIFSFIKTQSFDPHAVLPDRSEVTMDRGFLRAYAELLVKTCHRRGIHAMGGMAAQIPIKGDPEANERALRLVRADKLREVTDGHDGTWVAHPGLVPVAKKVFDEHMPGPNQIERSRDDVRVAEADLLAVPTGQPTERGLRHDIRVGIRYLESWLRGVGCVPIDGLMEDAATAEICRAQVWQWIHHRSTTSDGVEITEERVRSLIDEELRELVLVDETWRRWQQAAALFESLATQARFEEFLTVPAYDSMLSLDGS